MYAGLFCHFSAHSSLLRYGSWGLKETYEDTLNPKYLALKNCVFPANTSKLSLTEKTSIDSEFSVYPNPSSAVFHVDGISTNSYYELLSTTGQIVKFGRLTSNQIELNSLPTGIYLLKIGDRNGSLGIKRIVVSR